MNTKSLPWTAPEAAIINDNWRETDADIVTLLAKAGFARGQCAVSAYRHRKGLVKPRCGTDPKTAAARRTRSLEHREGWPALTGPHEQRDRDYVRMLKSALAEERAKHQSRALTQQGAA